MPITGNIHNTVQRVSNTLKQTKMKRIYKLLIFGLVLFAAANAFIAPMVGIATFAGKLLWNRAHAKDSGIFDTQLNQLNNVFESARDKGLSGYESFVDTLREHQQKLDEYYHPEKKSWTTAVQDQYDQAVDKLKEWECKAEEKMHELRYGPTSYSCEDKPWVSKAYDSVAHAAGQVGQGVVGGAKQTASKVASVVTGGTKQVADKAADAVGLDDLETAFNKARDEGQESLNALLSNIRDQRSKLEKMYDDTLDKASKTKDFTSDKGKQWKSHFKQQAGDSLRHFREMSDDFEQRIQDFLGTDKSRWGFFNKLKFW